MTKKILIIDDEKGICDVVKQGLEKLGDFKVSVAMNGEEGIRTAKKSRPDLILLDIRMPGKYDGVETLKRLKKDENTLAIPVVMMTAVLDESIKLECSGLYDELYLEKPVDLAVLKTKIEEVLKRCGVK
jgi:CheY-like chemotaxis protein